MVTSNFTIIISYYNNNFSSHSVAHSFSYAKGIEKHQSFVVWKKDIVLMFWIIHSSVRIDWECGDCDIYFIVNGHIPSWPVLLASLVDRRRRAGLAPKNTCLWLSIMDKWWAHRGKQMHMTTSWLAFASMNDLSSQFVSWVNWSPIVTTKSIESLWKRH